MDSKASDTAQHKRENKSSIKMAEAFGKIFLTTLFFYIILLLLLSLVFFVFLPDLLKPNGMTGIDVLVLANIGILFSSSCVLALGRWLPAYRLPNLLGFLNDQSELKIYPAPPREKAEATKDNVYLEKVRSMNTVVSILILIVTVVMVLNHELESPRHPPVSRPHFLYQAL